jgi:hypothetical protein
MFSGGRCKHTLQLIDDLHSKIFLWYCWVVCLPQDIVLLQEVWVDGDAQQLIRAGKAAGLKHCTHFR